MGREIKRVPLDFDWPLEKVWEGYINPHYEPCSHCRHGYSPSYDRVAKHIKGLMWDRDGDNDPIVAQITSYLAGRERHRGFLGHDSIDAWNAIKRLGRLAGLPDEWGTCGHCNGSELAPEAQAAYDAWESESHDPPEGEGWQVWENVSEGSPVSPVFATREELVDWLVSQGQSRSAAESFTKKGWVPSMVMSGGQMYVGIESADMLEEEA